MGATPKIVRCQRERTDETADPVVRLAMGKEGAVATVVLDHKQPNEKAGGWNCDEQRGPGVAQRESEPGYGPQYHERHNRDRQLGNAARLVGLAILGENLCPASRVNCRQT